VSGDGQADRPQQTAEHLPPEEDPWRKRYRARQNAELTDERDAVTRGKAEWEEKLAEAEEDRDAARVSLRRMMRRENTNRDAPEAG
jgi:hypothetical protein